MRAALARAAMAAAARCLGERRRDWAMAMKAEFEAAADDGRALGFAAGCLVAAWRGLPAHEEGRFALAGYALALGLMLPFAAMMAASVLGDFPASYLAADMNEGNRSATPSLALLVAALAAAQLRLAWLLLDRDWTGAAAAARWSAAMAASFVVVSVAVFADPGAALFHAGATAVVLVVAAGVARVFGGASIWGERLTR